MVQVGDTQVTMVSPPRQARARVVTGAELAAMTPGALEGLPRAHPEMVFARTSPQQKLVIVESCQRLVGTLGTMGVGWGHGYNLKFFMVGMVVDLKVSWHWGWSLSPSLLSLCPQGATMVGMEMVLKVPPWWG